MILFRMVPIAFLGTQLITPYSSFQDDADLEDPQLPHLVTRFAVPDPPGSLILHCTE